jgi:hypothetical protein
LQISEFTHDEESGDIDSIEMSENVNQLVDNMELTATYIQERFTQMGEYDKLIFDSVSEEMHSHHNSVNGLLEEHQDVIGDMLVEHHKGLVQHDQELHGSLKQKLYSMERRQVKIEGTISAISMGDPKTILMLICYANHHLLHFRKSCNEQHG